MGGSLRRQFHSLLGILLWPVAPEAAAAAATQALLLARRIGAPRCTSLVEGLLPRFQPYRSTPYVPELLHFATA